MKTFSPRVALFAGVAVVASMVTGVGVVSANSGSLPSQCAADHQYEWPGWGYGRHGSGTIVAPGSNAALGFPTRRPVAVDMPAGTYDISAAGYDGDVDRATDSPQRNEQFHLEFVDADGTVMATTGSTGDLPDEVEEATWAGGVGRVVLDRPAVTVRAVHSFTGTGPGTVNSVMPVCFGADIVAPPVTTTTTVVEEEEQTSPTTTQAPPTTTAAPDPEPETEPTTTTAAPTTTLAPTTTTVATVVLSVNEAAPAAAITATPSFTG